MRKCKNNLILTDFKQILVRRVRGWVIALEARVPILDPANQNIEQNNFKKVIVAKKRILTRPRTPA